MFLAVQIAVPLSRNGDGERSQRFGWQMFATVSDAPTFTVETAAGSRTISLDSYLARVRGDLDLPALLPPFLCETVLEAISVSWDDETFRCPTG